MSRAAQAGEPTCSGPLNGRPAVQHRVDHEALFLDRSVRTKPTSRKLYLKLARHAIRQRTPLELESVFWATARLTTIKANQHDLALGRVTAHPLALTRLKKLTEPGSHHPASLLRLHGLPCQQRPDPHRDTDPCGYGACLRFRQGALQSKML